MSENINISDLIPDERNANRGTERGAEMIETSLRKLGAGRSILVDKNGRIIAGNKTAEAAQHTGIEDVVIVRTDGKKLVAVMREDLDLDDPSGEARQLAYADNRAGQVSLEFDPDVIAEDLGAGIDLGDWWHEWEFEKFEGANEGDWRGAFESLPDSDRAPFQQMTFTLHDTQVEQVKRAIALSKSMGDFVDSENENSNGNALARLCELFIGEYGQG